MRTKLLLLLLLANFSIYAQYTSIPDINFENKLIALGIDSGIADGKVLTANVSNLTSLDVESSNISDLTGIESFLKLTDLNCSYNQLTSLSVSQNLVLTRINCAKNNISAIDVTKHTVLTELILDNNNFTEINVTKNLNLSILAVRDNFLSSIDVSKNPALTVLAASNNKITKISIADNPLLYYLDCSKNKLVTLNLKNGKNDLLDLISDFTDNPNLNCILVDNVAYSDIKWGTIKDATATYNSTSCPDYTAIPDINFENALIARGIDSGTPDGKVLTANAATVTSLDLLNSSISDLTGIEAFAMLNNLDCRKNKIATVNLSNNTKLTNLNIAENKLSSLDITANVLLESLDCRYNLIPVINVTQNTKLTRLYVRSNNLINLDVRSNVLLENLDCQTNKITSLDVSNNIKLTSLYVAGNKLTALNVKTNVLLKELVASTNNLTDLNVDNNIALTFLNCGNNQLSALDVSKNINLTRLFAYNNKITSFNISKNTLLDFFMCNSNLLTTIDVSKNTQLSILDCGENKITSIDISTNPKINELSCQNNQLVYLNLKNGNNTILDLTFSNFVNNPNLTCIRVDDVTYSNTNWATIKDATANYSTAICPALPYTLIPDINFENKLISLGIDSGAPDGKVLTANINTVQELSMQFSLISDLTGIQDFTNLMLLDCSNNNLTSLDISKNIAMTTLNCDDNKLTSLNLSKNIHLKTLNCNENLLTSLDVSNNLEITWLYCFENKLTSLDVTKNTLLDDLYFSDNKITNIDLSQNPLLISLYAENNLLTSLDLSKNPELVILYVRKNQIADIDISLNPKISLFNCSYNALNSANLKNGKNTILNSGFNITNNPNLTCIQVDDATYSNTNWSTKKDATANYSTDCSVAFVVISDKNFEQKLIDLGIDTDGLNGKISIANINSITTLDLSNSNISDITGIKDFKALTFLNISNNQITSLDLSNNTLLEILNASSNQLTTLDLSNNTKLTIVYITNNPLVSLNLRNGNNKNFILPSQTGKQSASGLYTSFLGLTTLGCIQVDDAAYSNANWSNIKESTTIYSNTCKTLGVDDAVFAKATIYPNPTNGEVNISNIILEKANVYNELGQLVKTFTLDSNNTNNKINLSGLSKGVYYVYLINGDSASAKKVIVE